MLDGWLIFFRGITVCQKHKRVWWFVLPPILLNFFLFIGLFYLGAEYLTPAFLDVLQSWIGDIPAFFRYLVMGLFIYVFYLFVVYFFNALGLLVGSLFYTIMAARYVRILQREGQIPHEGTVEVFQPNLLKILKYEVVKFALITVGGGVFTLLSWLMPYLSFVFLIALILLLSFEYFDYAFEGLNLSYGERVDWMRKSAWTFFSSGLVVYLILSIPLLGFVLSPICVVGATDLVVTRKQIAG
jgi:CysZ protein